jgi:ARG and Rhodanese-Phosphatase-superfamily-associated Protein domain
MFTLPAVRIGEPIRHESLTVFPLFAEPDRPVDYVLSDEAIAAGAVTVQEVSEGGSVPDLLVENAADARVLFLEGEELVGAKQNRVLNTSLLIPARSKVKVPVSCVERGRWSYVSRHFGHSGRYSHSKLRHALKSSVSESLSEGSGHRSDQGKVWEEIDRQQEALGVSSATAAMSDTYQAHQAHIDTVAERFPYPEGAAGMAVALGDKVVAVDLFDKPATCRKVWRRLLSGFLLEAAEPTAGAAQAERPAVEGKLAALRDSPWEKVPPVGDGEEYRGRSTGGDQASALALGDALVHGSLLTGA